MNQRINTAFSLIELLVALALIVMMLTGAGYIFNVAVKAQRTARASCEIMDRLRVVTDQLNSDFKNIIKDAPILTRFEYYYADENGDGVDEEHRLDQIMFFTTGQFTSLRQYYDQDTTLPLNQRQKYTIQGNLARIQYSLSRKVGADGLTVYDKLRDTANAADPFEPYQRFLTRRQHIVTLEPASAINIRLFPDLEDIYNIPGENCFKRDEDSIYEHDSVSFNRWKSIEIPSTNSDDEIDYEEEVVPYLFEKLVNIDVKDTGIAEPAKRLHLLLSEGVSDLWIQFAYKTTVKINGQDVEKIQWFPCRNPDEDNDCDDSQFSEKLVDGKLNSHGEENISDTWGQLGLAMNVNEVDGTDFKPVYSETSKAGSSYQMDDDWVVHKLELAAIKFTFTLHDSRNLIEGGKTFSHMIYLD